MVEASWPNLPNYAEFSEADHAAHRSPKGIAYPTDLIPGADARKHARQLMKVARKPHLNMKGPRKTSVRRRKKL